MAEWSTDRLPKPKENQRSNLCRLLRWSNAGNSFLVSDTFRPAVWSWRRRLLQLSEHRELGSAEERRERALRFPERRNTDRFDHSWRGVVDESAATFLQSFARLRFSAAESRETTGKKICNENSIRSSYLSTCIFLIAFLARRARLPRFRELLLYGEGAGIGFFASCSLDEEEDDDDEDEDDDDEDERFCSPFSFSSSSLLAKAR